MLKSKTQMVSYILLDSEQLLTYAYPPKNASKYSPKIFFEYPKDFRGLIRPLKFFLGGLSMFGVHPQGLEGIYI